MKRLIALAIGIAVMLISTLAAEAGRIKFLDGTYCYYVSPYFGKNIIGTYSLYKNGVSVQGPFDLGRFGEYGNAPSRPGITTPTAPGTYEVRVTCGSTIYKIPVGNQFSLPSVDLFMDNRSPRFKLLQVEYPIILGGGYQKVVRVPPGSTVHIRARYSDPGGALVPKETVKSPFGTISQVSITQIDSTVWELIFDWKLPADKGWYDAYVLIDDRRGGYVEGGVNINAADGPVQTPVASTPAAALPSAKAGQLDQFLTFWSTRGSDYPDTGADTAETSCAYYKALGFATGCNGKVMTGEITFAQWKKSWGFTALGMLGSDADAGKVVVPSTTVSATYVNLADLGLERAMHATSTSKGKAFYVCNHPYSDPLRGEDPLLNRAINGDLLVACVAMEYSATTGINSGKKFTKFLVFAPNGRLVRQANLDGRGSKYIPGNCVVCHGASPNYTHYGDPATAPTPALGAKFLPFDLGNFAFADRDGYRKADLQDEFRKLNDYVRQTTKAGDPIRELVDGWYPTSTSNFTGGFVPPGWAGNTSLYNRVVKPACRTCHIAMPASFNTLAQFDTYASFIKTHVCGNTGNYEKSRYSMPNARVTFDRFWTSTGGVSGVDQPATLRDYLRTKLGDSSLKCDPPK
ncbi:hypothetical protein [Oryzibacter oryziterrae]|uniref:hypothetical protein n=1 Tax=Oryzibacter oryziterrae TaxID=2766474 RepID=UPI001F42FF66|nr:hypothetical protein [Oryzibacter oryziterrae]